MAEDGVTDSVKQYYGKELQTSDDLKTNACCTGVAIPKRVKEAISRCHPEVIAKYYGCGLVIPDLLEGCSVLDLGCGAGRDCYIASQFVGEKGSVVGVDMTEEQLAVAHKHVAYHGEKFGYAAPNTQFKMGYIEKLDQCDLADNSFDVIISNCVINLSNDKPAVLREAYRVLKPGGELYFSDVYSDRRVPEHLVKDPVLWGECLSGALYWNDFLRLSRDAGFLDARLVADERITVKNEKLEQLIGHIGFYSATYRLFKLPNLESDCEDYGQAVIYKGTIPHCEHAFKLDGHHLIETGKIFPVCGNTYDMLHDTRFKPHFDFLGDRARHFGIYPGCGKSLPFASAADGAAGGGGCC